MCRAAAASGGYALDRKPVPSLLALLRSVRRQLTALVRFFCTCSAREAYLAHSSEKDVTPRLQYQTFGDECNLASGVDLRYSYLTLKESDSSKLPTANFAQGAVKKYIQIYTTRMALATKRILNSRLGALVARSGLTRVFGLLATAVAVLATLSWSHRRQADEAYANQLSLNQMSVLTRQINSLKLTALQRQDLTPGVEAERRSARATLREAALAAQLYTHHTATLEEVWPAFDSYIMSADRQWLLIQVGNFDEGKLAEFQAVGSQFDLMQHNVQVAIEAEDKWAQDASLKARYELLAAAVLAATSVLILFLRLQKQEHLGQLQETERNVLRQSEERFRALTEQSTDIILIADPSGRIKYASPSVHAVLAVHGDSLVGANMSDLAHPDDIPRTMSAGSRSVAYEPSPER